MLNIPHLHAKMLERDRPGISRIILEEGWIGAAINHRDNPAMMALFNIYMECIDGSSLLDDETCFLCRETVLNDFKLMLPYIKNAAGIEPVDSDFRQGGYREMYNKTFGI